MSSLAVLSATLCILAKQAGAGRVCRPERCPCVGAPGQQDPVISIAGSLPGSAGPPRPGTHGTVATLTICRIQDCSGLEGSRPYITLSDQLELLDTPEKVAAVETAGHTLEFLPGDNTVIQIEGTSSRITRITR